MRYAISAPVHFEEATPHGLISADFAEGEVDVEDCSEEHFVAEYRLVPAGIAERVGPSPDVPLAAVPMPPASEPEHVEPAHEDAPESAPETAPEAPAEAPAPAAPDAQE